MKRLVDAIAYCKELYLERDYPGRAEEFISAMEVAIADLGDMPTVDAIEVVYCKDCARYKKGFCTIRKDSWGATLQVGKHDFCSDAERRTDERKAD